MPWNPLFIRHADRAFQTATDTVRVTTNAGPGFLKALGNHGGPHLLAADFVATQLAQWLNLPVFEYAIVTVTADDEIIFWNGQRAIPGPAFITRENSGTPWGGSAGELEALVNPEDICKLVLFDTWTRNCDRYPADLNARKPNRDNVFFSNEGLPDGQFRLMAMDHTHCFYCGNDLTGQLSNIDLVKDERIFGLFPEFVPYLAPHRGAFDDAVARLRTLDQEWVRRVADDIPHAWEVDAAGRNGLVRLITERADYVAETIGQTLFGELD